MNFYLQVLKALEDWHSTERLPFTCQPPRFVSSTYGPFWETQASWAELWSIMGNGSSCDQQGWPSHPSDPVHSLWHSCITSRRPGKFQGYICNLTLYVILPTPLAARMFPRIKWYNSFFLWRGCLLLSLHQAGVPQKYDKNSRLKVSAHQESVIGTHTFIMMIYNNHNLLHLYSAFLGTQSALHSKGLSPHPPPMCSIHMDDVTAAILGQNAHHTPAYWWRGDRVMEPISVWGWLGGHDGQRPMGEFGQDAEVTPVLFSKYILGFLMTTESGPRFNVSCEGWCFLQYSVPVTTLGR